MIVGRTGSGKSTLARAILLQYRYVVVIDTKQEFDLPEAEIITDPRKLARLGKRHERPIVYRPADEFDTLDYHNQVLVWAFRRGNCTVYVDEVFDLMRGNTVAPALIKLLKQGRSKGIRTIVSTQRPRSIPVSLLSESDHYYMFELLLADDRKRMAEVMGPAVLGELPHPYDFWYYDVHSNRPPAIARLKVRA